MIIETEGYKFDFPNAIELFKFDDEDKNSEHYHGLSHCMKAVDVVAVFEKYQLWIEIKNFHEMNITSFGDNPNEKGTKKQKSLTDYINDLKLKFRDTFIYRYCEGKDSLPIYYVFLTNLPENLCLICSKTLSENIPTVKIPDRWIRTLLNKDCFQVSTAETWARNSYLKEAFGNCTKINI